MNFTSFVLGLFGIGFLVFIALAALLLAVMPFTKRGFSLDPQDVLLVLACVIIFGIFGIFSFVAITGFISAL